MFILKSILDFNTIFNDAPTPWALGFQDGASQTFEGIVELHNEIFFYIIIILVGVFWLLSSVIINFNTVTNKIVNKYHNHGMNVPIQKYSILKRSYSSISTLPNVDNSNIAVKYENAFLMKKKIFFN
jgi:cytochrome c oxidase subunit 2